MTRKMRKPDLIERLQRAEPVPHRPRFQVRQEGLCWIVSDATKPVALVVRDVGTGGAMLDVLTFRPGVAGPLVKPLPRHYHYSTRLGYGASFNWSVDTMFQSPDVGSLRLVEETRNRVLFLHRGQYRDGSSMAARLAIGYDAAVGQYSYDLTWEIASTRDVVGEFCNVFHRNLMHTDMATREYDYGCYVRQDRGWEKYPINILVTGLQQRRLQKIPLALGGGCGHINRNGVVPMIVHRAANVPLTAGSCDTCFDLHQMARVTAGTPAHIASRFADVGPVVAAHPEELSMLAFDDLEAFRFHMGEVCDFSRTIRASEPWAGGVWQMGKGVALSVKQSHGGVRSLVLTSTPSKPLGTVPYGAALAFTHHTEYEASLWVKVEGDAGVRATLELNAFLFTAANPRCVATASVVGPHDWTRLTVRVNSGVADNGYLTLGVTGQGRAWFDQILMRKVAATQQS